MILDTLAIARFYKKLPSEILGIEDVYTSYCLNEACAVIEGRLRNDEKPVITVAPSKNYSKPSDVYKKYEGR